MGGGAEGRDCRYSLTEFVLKYAPPTCLSVRFSQWVATNKCVDMSQITSGAFAPIFLTVRFAFNLLSAMRMNDLTLHAEPFQNDMSSQTPKMSDSCRKNL